MPGLVGLHCFILMLDGKEISTLTIQGIALGRRAA